MIHVFGDFELDETQYELRCAGERVRLEPKVFDVIRHLLAHRERVVPKAELLDAVWPGETVTESALPRAVAAARRALRDDRAAQAVIRTVHGRGYQFVAQVVDRPEAQAPIAARPPGTGEVATAPFVGRDAVLSRLRDGLDRAAEGQGCLFLLFGEPGIGKTRTAEELCGAARARGFEVRAGRCYEGEGAPAFWPWVQILRGCTEALRGAPLAEELGREADALAHLLPELLERLPDAPASLPRGLEESRFRLFEGVNRYLARRAAARPLLLFVDDLHWADKPTVLLLRHLAREIRDRPILLIAGYREVELRRGSPLGEVLSSLTREPHAERVALRGLPRDAVRRFIEASAQAPADDALVEAVSEITEGNPFFLVETVRLLIAEETLGTSAGRSAWDASLPQGLRDVIGRRLDRLSPECNRVLTLAAVVGQEFRLEVLERFAAVPAERLLEVLDEAARGRLIGESRGALGRYAFCHALIRQCIYEELATPVRVRLHRQLAEILEELYRDAPEVHLDALAHHFFQAAPGGDIDRAVDYSARAGASALRLLAYEEAAGWFTRALQALDLRAPPDEERRCRLLLDLGEAYELSGERSRMRETYWEAAARARSLGRPDLLARAALGFAGRTERGSGDAQQRALLEEALAALGETHPGLRARLLGYLAGTPPNDALIETRTALAERAVELARASGDPDAQIVALSARAWAMLGPDCVRERLAAAEELLELADRTGILQARFTGMEMRIRSLLTLGDAVAVDREVARYEQLAQESRLPAFRFLHAVNRVARAISRGEYDVARALAEECYELGLATEHPATGPIVVGHLLWLYRERGDFEALESLLADGADLLATAASTAAQPLRCIQAYLALQLGREAEARRQLDALAEADFADLPRNEHWLVALSTLSALCVELPDLARAERLYALLRPYASLNAVHDLLRTDLGSVSFVLGILAGALGRDDAAVEHLEAALEANAQMGARGHLARTRVELAAVLLRRGAKGDRTRARALLDDAGRAATALGMRGLEERIAEVRR